MKLIRRRDPWFPMHRFLHRPLGPNRDWLTDFFDSDLGVADSEFSPAVDIAETEDAYVVKAELPGLTKDDVNLELRENTLILSGERKQESEEKKKDYHRVESRYGSFSRSFLLPSNIDTDNVDAKFKDGMLEVTLHKKPEHKAHAIKIQ